MRLKRRTETFKLRCYTSATYVHGQYTGVVSDHGGHVTHMVMVMVMVMVRLSKGHELVILTSECEQAKK